MQFASKARDYPGCVDLHVLDSPETVARLSGCLRSVAAAYRKGLDPALGKAIGIDTNYVAAMEQAAKHLPADAERPVMILFTDGKHDVRGVPGSQVQVAQDRLFGKRTPFALLPVGMGLAAKDRPALEAGLNRMRITKDMPACVSGATFDWPQVVFQTRPTEAGNAVGVALQDATCTFTVAPQPTATPGPPPAVPGGVRAIRVRPHDGQIDLAWAPPAAPDPPVVDYLARCAAGGGDFIEFDRGRLDQDDRHGPRRAGGVRLPLRGRRSRCRRAGALDRGLRGDAWFRRRPPPSRPSVRSIARSR